MEGFLFFLGRFHVLALHLPIGILSLAIVLEVMARNRRFAGLAPAVTPLWVAGALTALLTAVLGLMHSGEADFQDSAAVGAHRAAGLGLTLAAVVVAGLRLRGSALYARAWPAALGIVAALLFVTGHLGGNLTHGDVYLVQYAPAPVRWLARLPPEAAPRPRPKDLASADIYLDVVAPALRERCAGCHSVSKHSGGLVLATFDGIMAGGKDGPALVPGDPAKSELFRRISLPEGAKDFMPKDGKPPLTQAQVAAIGWWIAQGAPKSAPIGKLKLTPAAAPALMQVLGFAEAQESEAAHAGGGADENAALPQVKPADPSAVAALEASGFLVRPIARGSSLLDIDYTARRPMTDQDVAALARIGPQALRLNLRRAALGDGQLRALAGALPNLRHLRLEGNDVTDAGLAQLGALKELRYLNLYGTKVSDAGLSALAALPKLREAYLWQSAVTDAGAKAFREAHPGVLVDTGLKPADVPKETKVLLPR